MKFYFLCAGVPTEIFDAVRKERAFIGGNNTEVELLPSAGPWGCAFHDGIPARAIELFKTRTALDDPSDDPSAYAVLYVPTANDSILLTPLFPAIYACAVPWEGLTGYDPISIAQSKNALVKAFQLKAVAVRGAITALAREVKEQSQRTPWLLPVRNFRSGHLRSALEEVQTDLVAAPVKPEKLKDLSTRFRQIHPPQKSGEGHGGDRSYFIDETELAFKPPGRHLHGYHSAGENSGHNAVCYIASRRRLGTPYIKSFHYDCTRGDTVPTHASLCSCHSDERISKEAPKNFNIAPNDYTRP